MLSKVNAWRRSASCEGTALGCLPPPCLKPTTVSLIKNIFQHAWVHVYSVQLAFYTCNAFETQDNSHFNTKRKMLSTNIPT